MNVSHSQRDISVNLNGVAAFNGIVITALYPRCQCEALIGGKIGIAADKVSKRALPGSPKSLRSSCERGTEENPALFEIVGIIHHLTGSSFVVPMFLVDLADLYQSIAPGLLSCIDFSLSDCGFG